MKHIKYCETSDCPAYIPTVKKETPFNRADGGKVKVECRLFMPVSVEGLTHKMDYHVWGCVKLQDKYSGVSLIELQPLKAITFELIDNELFVTLNGHVCEYAIDDLYFYTSDTIGEYFDKNRCKLLPNNPDKLARKLWKFLSAAKIDRFDFFGFNINFN